MYMGIDREYDDEITMRVCGGSHTKYTTVSVVDVGQNVVPSGTSCEVLYKCTGACNM